MTHPSAGGSVKGPPTFSDANRQRGWRACDASARSNLTSGAPRAHAPLPGYPVGMAPGLGASAWQRLDVDLLEGA